MQERKGEGKKQTVFPALSRPNSLDRGGSAPAEVGGGEGLTAGCWNVGEDLQDRVFLFAGGIVVDVFCEMVHFAGGGLCLCVCWGGGVLGGIYGGCWRRWWWGRQSRTQTLAPSP